VEEVQGADCHGITELVASAMTVLMRHEQKADQLIQWLPDSTMAALQRIPPKKRLKEV
jgi:methionine aminopeptidase